MPSIMPATVGSSITPKPSRMGRRIPSPSPPKRRSPKMYTTVAAKSTCTPSITLTASSESSKSSIVA